MGSIPSSLCRTISPIFKFCDEVYHLVNFFLDACEIIWRSTSPKMIHYDAMMHLLTGTLNGEAITTHCNLQVLCISE